MPAHMSTQSSSVWEVMRGEFKLNHQLSRPEVQRQLHWLAAHPGYLQQLSKARPYLYHIVTEIKKRNMPGEIALIPMIESAYDPFVYSNVGAAGLWQIMPHTGKDLGLKKDWWADHRRSITPSTNAALNYLEYLHRFFNGNWDLAIAAYDSGEGTVARAIKRVGQRADHGDFWTLKLPQETQNYVPRLLALAEIISHAERYHVTLPAIPHVPYFEEVNINKQIDLNHAAQMAGMSYQELIKLNPGFNRWTTAPYKPFKLLIPTGKVDRFYQNLATISKKQAASLTNHHVHAGETLKSLAKRYYTTVSLIRQLNQLDSDTLKPGQALLIPVQQLLTAHVQTPSPIVTPPLPSVLKVIHIVQKKDDLNKIAQKYQTTQELIQTWNHLDKQSPIKKGQQLVIWKKSGVKV
jgi:membrane-bound lytic murein transglycosylase D